MTFIGTILKPNITAQPHDTTFNPVALWQFNESLLDSSGNGLTLDLNAGTESYVEILPNLIGFHFDGSTGLDRNGVNDTELTITGDLTIEAIINQITLAGSTNIVSFAASSGETEATNFLYSFSVADTGTINYVAEEGAGNNITDVSDDRMPIGRIYHFAVVRENDLLTYYIDGEVVDNRTPTNASNPGVITPSGGTSSEINIWQSAAKTPAPSDGIISSLKIIDAALTAEQVKSEYNLTLGPVLGKK